MVEIITYFVNKMISAEKPKVSLRPPFHHYLYALMFHNLSSLSPHITHSLNFFGSPLCNFSLSWSLCSIYRAVLLARYLRKHFWVIITIIAQGWKRSGKTWNCQGIYKWSQYQGIIREFHLNIRELSGDLQIISISGIYQGISFGNFSPNFRIYLSLWNPVF